MAARNFYRASGFVQGLKAEEMDLGDGYDSLLRKLRAKRCDYFVEELEIMSNFEGMGKNVLIEPDIRHVNAPWAVAPSRYMITAKNGKNSKMIAKINEALQTLIKTGKAEAIFKMQVPGITYKP